MLADALSVTVGTVGRAYAEIERQGLVTSRVGDGTYPCPRRADAQNEFDNAPDGKPGLIDLSRNMHIPGKSRRFWAGVAAPWRRPASADAARRLSPDTGLGRHREAGAQWIGLSGRDAVADHIVVSNGAQHALLCTMMATLRKDELIVSEHLTYPGSWPPRGARCSPGRPGDGRAGLAARGAGRGVFAAAGACALLHADPPQSDHRNHGPGAPARRSRISVCGTTC